MDLNKLKSLRVRRMEQSFIELQTQRQTLSAWEITVQKKEQELRDFQRWRLNHQESMFADLKNNTFNPQALLDYHKKLDQLRLQEESLREELAETYRAMQAAHAQMEIARKQSAEANIKLEKVKEIIQIHDAKKSSEELAQ